MLSRSTTSRLPKRRYGLVAVAIGMLVAVAASSAADESGWEDLAPPPASFELATPHIGDQGTYAVRLLQRSGAELKVMQDVARYQFKREPDRHVFDQEFKARHVEVLRQTNFTIAAPGPTVSGDVELHIDPTRGTIVSAIVSDATLDLYRGEGWVPGFPAFSDEASDLTRMFQFGPMNALCAWGLPSGSWSLDEPVGLFSDCAWSRNRTMKSDFEPLGVATSGEWAGSIVFRAVDESSTYLWLDPDTPYPQRFIEPGLRPGQAYEFVLVEFKRGTEAPKPPQPPTRNPSALAVVETDWMGLDETSFISPFTMREALRHALEDPLNSTVRDFLRDHPEAYLFYVTNWGDISLDDGGKMWQWDFFFSDGQDHLGVLVMKWRDVKDFYVTDPVNSWPHAQNGIAQRALETAWIMAAPTKDRLPSSMPTVRSMLAAWPFFAGPEFNQRQPNLWGYEIACPDRACLAPAVHAFAGHGNMDLRSNNHPEVLPTFQASWAYNYSYVGVSEDGVLDYNWERQNEGRMFYGSPSTPAPLSTVSATEPAASPTRATVWLPFAPTFERLGFLAILAGFLYWLAPILKQFVWTPAYTRLVRPSVLNHPARAEMLAAIEAEPGIHFQELQRRLGKGPSHILHHIRTLAKFGLVRQFTAPGHTCYFPKGYGGSPGLIPAVAVLRSKGARQVLAEISNSPGISVKDIAERLNVASPTVTYHLRRLMGAELVTVSRKHGRTLALLPTSLAAQAMAAT